MPLIIILCVSTLLGFLTGLGIGGGSLLILWLTLVENQGIETARGINLLFFLPAALPACFGKNRANWTCTGCGLLWQQEQQQRRYFP